MTIATLRLLLCVAVAGAALRPLFVGSRTGDLLRSAKVPTLLLR